jgi:hypothetical protein
MGMAMYLLHAGDGDNVDEENLTRSAHEGRDYLKRNQQQRQLREQAKPREKAGENKKRMRRGSAEI